MIKIYTDNYLIFKIIFSSLLPYQVIIVIVILLKSNLRNCISILLHYSCPGAIILRFMRHFIERVIYRDYKFCVKS